jgi:hypothetical protein
MLDLKPTHVEWTDISPEEPEDANKSHHLSFYGMWIGMGWLIAKGLASVKRAIAEDQETRLEEALARLKAEMADATAETSSAVAAGKAATAGTMVSLSGHGDGAGQGGEPVAAVLMPELIGSRGYDFVSATSIPAGVAALSSGGGAPSGGGAAPVSWPGNVLVPLQPPAAGETIYPSYPVSGEDTTSLFETLFPVDDELHVVWQEAGPLDASQIVDVTMPDGLPGYSFVDGDFYDIQITLDYGLFDDMPGAGLQGPISFGSTLDSGASDYDAVVIDGDLIEINMVVQFNALVEADLDGLLAPPPDGDFHVQSNAAVIAEYTHDAAAQYTADSELNVATVEQGNIAMDVAGAVQVNDAAILQIARDAADVDVPDIPAVDVGSISSSLAELFPELADDPDAGVLSVKGSYVEVNLIVQASGAVTNGSGGEQDNDAVLKDFDGVAAQQYVGGNVVDVNAITQVNEIAKPGHGVPDWLAEAFPGKGLEKASGLVGELLDKHAKGSFEHHGNHHHGRGKGHDNHDDDHHHHGHMAKSFGDPLSDWTS